MWVILLKTGPKRVPFPDEIKMKLKHDFFKITTIFLMECVWRNKGNATMGKCIIIYCAVSLFLVKLATFSWPPFVTWLWEGELIADNSLESFTI